MHQSHDHSGALRIIIEQDAGFVAWLSDQFKAVFQRLDNLEKHLAQQDTRLDLMEKNIMATLDQVLADVTAESTQIDSVLTLIQGLRDQIAAIPGITPAMQAQIDAIFTGAEANKAKLDSALTANVPQPAPTPAPAPATPAGSSGSGL